MPYRKIFCSFLLWCMVLVTSLYAAEDKNAIVNLDELSIGTGVIIPGYSGYQGRIGEYTIFDRGVRPTWEFKGFGKIDSSTYFRLEGVYEDEKDQTYAADLDFKRILRGEFDYSRFRHWTDHDSLNFSWPASDNQPNADYTVTRSLTKSTLIYSPAGLPNIAFNLDYREEGRSGVRQVLSIQDYFGEILSDGKPTDEVTRDYAAGITFRQGMLTLDNTFWYRKFEDNGPNVLVAGPGSKPYTLVSEFDRYQNTLAATIDDLPLNTGFYTNYTYYNVDNSNEIDYNSFIARLTSVPLTNLTLGLAYRYQKAENDVTKWYDASLRSALDREINTFTFDSTLHVLRSATLRYKYEWEGITREDSGLERIHPLETERNTHLIAVQSRVPIATKKVRLKVEYRRDDIDDPFMNLRFWRDAQELGEYYPQLSPNPTESDRVKVRIGFPLSSSLEISLDGEWGDKEFESEDSSTSQWDEEYIQPSVTISYMPLSNLATYLSYSYSQKRTNTRFAPALPDTFFSNEIEYDEDSNIWSAGISYQPSTDLNVSAFLTYSTQKAEFDSSDLKGTDLSSLGDLGEISEHDIKTSEVSVSGDYRLSKQLFLRAQFIYEYSDNDNIYLYDIEGKGYMGIVGLTWRFI